MSTILRRLPNVNADSVGIPPIAVSQDEIDLMLSPSLLHWWDAGHGYDNVSWMCRKTGIKLVTELSDPVPATLVPADTAYNGAPSLLFSTRSRMWDGGSNIFPVGGEFTVVFVGRPGPDNNAFMWGARNDGDSVTTRFVWTGSTAGNGSQSLLINGSGTLTQSDAKKYSDGPFIYFASHNPSLPSDRAWLKRISLVTGGELSVTGASSATANSRAQFTLGAANSGPLIGGEIATVMIFNKAVNGVPALQSLVESVLKARYSVS